MNPLQKVATLQQYKKGALIHPFEHLDTTVYMLVSGQAELVIRDGGQEHTGSVIDKGRLFGGLGLVRDNSREIKVTASQDCAALIVQLKVLNAYRIKEKEEGSLLFKDVLTRIHQFNQFLTKELEGAVTASLEGFFNQSPYKVLVAPEDEASYIMEKAFTCPVCGHSSKSSVIRGTKLKMIANGDFFVKVYDHIEPLWYNLVTCDNCNFTERAETFENEIKYDTKKFKEKLMAINAQYQVTYSSPRTLEEVINGFVMYKKTMDIRELEDRVKARGLLLMYEVFERAGFEEEANKYRDRAFDFYNGMFASGILDVNDLQLQQLYIILGKLHEKRGETKEAKTAYRNAKMVKTDETKFIDMAEEYLIDLDN